jgi:hypothetical protein
VGINLAVSELALGATTGFVAARTVGTGTVGTGTSTTGLATLLASLMWVDFALGEL